MKTYLCREGEQEFTIQANSYEEAMRYAMLYGAIVVKELK